MCFNSCSKPGGFCECFHAKYGIHGSRPHVAVVGWWWWWVFLLFKIFLPIAIITTTTLRLLLLLLLLLYIIIIINDYCYYCYYYILLLQLCIIIIITITQWYHYHYYCYCLILFSLLLLIIVVIIIIIKYHYCILYNYIIITTVIFFIIKNIIITIISMNILIILYFQSARLLWIGSRSFDLCRLGRGESLLAAIWSVERLPWSCHPLLEDGDRGASWILVKWSAKVWGIWRFHEVSWNGGIPKTHGKMMFKRGWFGASLFLGNLHMKMNLDTMNDWYWNGSPIW